MSAPSKPPLRIALVVPDPPCSPGAEQGAARLAHWIADDPRMRLVDVAHRAAPPMRGLAGALLRIEDRLVNRPSASAMPPPTGEAPDLVVDLAGGAPGGPLPRFGIWRLSAYRPEVAVPAAFEAVARAAPTVEACLTCQTDTGTHTLACARYNRKPTAALNAAFAAEKSVQLVQRALAELHLTGELPVRAGDASGDEADPATGAFATQGPTPGEHRSAAGVPSAPILRYGARMAGVLAQRGAARIAHRAGRQPELFAMRLCAGDPLSFDPARGTTLVPPRGRFWADPFLLRRSGNDYLFFEEFHDTTQCGVLKVGRLDGDRMEELGEVLSSPHHLSFPFLFEDDDADRPDAEDGGKRAQGGGIWMIPETSRADRLEVWRATDFPLRWERVATAFEGRAPADSVLTRIDGVWWLFTHFSHDSFRDYCSELHVFRVDGPRLRQIEPHPLNPVVIDSRTARAGGRIWTQNGRVYRASQDNANGTYGWGLNIMEITAIDMERYSERRVRHIAPGFAPDVTGCHHIDFAGDRVVIDLRYTNAAAARRG